MKTAQSAGVILFNWNLEFAFASPSLTDEGWKIYVVSERDFVVSV